MPKVEEFYHLKKDGAARGAHAAQARALRERNHNFRHFRSFLILAHLLLLIGSMDSIKASKRVSTWASE